VFWAGPDAGYYPDGLVLWPPSGFCYVLKLVHAVVGSSPVAFRAVDLLVVGLIVGMLLTMPHAPRRPRAFPAFVMTYFYLSTTEFCHGQPDTWMLFPALGAVWIRERRAVELWAARRRPVASAALLSFGEGALWALAFSIKPYAALAAPVCLVISLLPAYRRRTATAAQLAADALAVALGSLAVGACVVVAFRVSGAWPRVLESLAEIPRWAGEYYAGTPDTWQRAVFMLCWSVPWGLVNAVGIVAAVGAIGRVVRRPAPSPSGCGDGDPPVALAVFGAFFLVWTYQANFVQFQYPYHVVSGTLLGLSLIGSLSWQRLPTPVLRLAVAAFLVAATVPHPEFKHYWPKPGWSFRAHPITRWDRTSIWGRCFREGSSPEMRDLLTLETHPGAPDWRDLERVGEYLRAHGVQDHEVTCYSASVLSLYTRLRVKPSTRYFMLSAAMTIFPSHRPEIVRELEESPQRFVVSDLCDHAITIEQARGLGEIPKVMRQAFPFSYPILYRAGRYLVHDATSHRLVRRR
jgi:hypothetical protein